MRRSRARYFKLSAQAEPPGSRAASGGNKPPCLCASVSEKHCPPAASKCQDNGMAPDSPIIQIRASACQSDHPRLCARPFDGPGAREDQGCADGLSAQRWIRQRLRPLRPPCFPRMPDLENARDGIRLRGQFGLQDRRIQPPGRKNVKSGLQPHGLIGKSHARRFRETPQ